MSNISKQEVVKQLCKLTTTVGSVEFGHTSPYDCFCEEYRAFLGEDFRFDQEIIDYIKDAVYSKLSKHFLSEIRITMVDLDSEEIETSRGDSFTINFLMDKNLPDVIFIFSKGKSRSVHTLNEEFGGGGCSLEKWYESKLQDFITSVCY